MLRPIVFLSLSVAASSVCTAESDSRDCNPFSDASLAAAACGRLIEGSSGHSSGLADAYTFRGFAHFRNGNIDQAMADYAEALRRNPKQVSTYQFRGDTYIAQNKDALAISDFTKGIELDPKDPMLRVGRGAAYSLQGQRKLALADYDAAVALDEKNFIPPLVRGIFYYYDNAPDKARADFARAATIAPTDYMPPIWLHIAETRMGLKSGLAATPQRFDMTKWPAPLVRLFLGEDTPETLLSPNHPDVAKHPILICDHTFYVAEFLSLQGKKEEAQRMFEAAEQKCPRYFVEGVAAPAALRSLKTAR